MGNGNICVNSRDYVNDRQFTLQHPKYSKDMKNLFVNNIPSDYYNQANPSSNKIICQNFFNNSNFITINSRKWFKAAPKKNINSLISYNYYNFNLKEQSFQSEELQQEDKTKIIDNNINKHDNLIVLPLGDKYEGELYNNKPQGYGKYYSATGVIREGFFINGQLNGKGKMNLNNGIYLEGNFINDKLNGEGKSININGEIYEGEFLDGKRHGKGHLILFLFKKFFSNLY